MSSKSFADEIDFVAQIRPILQERCFACHGALKQEASLRVDSARNLHLGGDSGEAIDVDSVRDSELLLRITDPDESTRMPPEGKPLTRKEIQLITEWIRQGAKIPKDDFAEESPGDHWSFQIPTKSLTFKSATERKDNPIDLLLEGRRSQAGLKSTQETAPRSLLLRRVYIDLVGVPPTLAELQAFEADDSPNAYARVVEHLLSRPQYGERWGRHWMDVWRYTDWYGLGAQLRNSQKHIWHWRDWIVDSLNNDQGYDQMIREMLAADEIFPADRDKLRATGFLARNYYLFNRTTWLDSTIEHTGKAFLGLTLNCAKCHDHKYDPISQSDYYRLRAIFEPHQVRLDPVPGTTDLEKDGLPRVFDAHPEVPTYVHIRGNEKEPDKSQKMAAGVPEFFGFQKYESSEISLPPNAYRPELQEFVLADRLVNLESEISKAEQAVNTARQKFEKLSQSSTEKSDKSADYLKLDLKTVPADQLLLNDSFETLDTKTWRIVNGKWKVIDGQLVQQETGAASRIVENTTSHPRDFLLEARMQVTGGQKWKSFGIRFDATTSHEKTVYLSAFSDSKVQVSYANNGNSTYPATGLAKLPIKENQDYLLRIAIRGNLINVALDGQHQVAYEFPIERQTGKIQLMSFDSVAAFDQIRMAKLPESIRLHASGQAKPLTVEEAKYQFQLTQAKLKAAKLKRTAVRTGHLADQAQATQKPNVKDLVRQAVLARIDFDQAQKQVALAELEAKLKGAPEKEKQKLEKSLADTRKQLEALKEETTKPGTRYESIRASRKALEGPDEKPESRNQPYPKISTGRRTALANWIVAPRNPLTARVAVNQIWMRHFGRPIVDPVIDFGRRAKPPIQQELLDWLAADLMENGWKMKRIHQLIVTSKAYQMSGNDPSIEVAPGNPYYQVRSSMRMESQVVRDSLLQLSGQLEEKLGGPPIDPQKQEMSQRRSLYFRQSRDHQHKFVGMFDDADILRCYRRQESIIPQQALALANSRIVYQAAQKIVANVSRTAVNDTEFIRQAGLLILSRQLDESEVRICRESLNELKRLADERGRPEQQGSKPMDSDMRARSGVVLALINSNDFVTIR